jgi:two-component sensor histidine kinase/PAS domain-containing protein
VGFTADYVVGVWMGYDDNRPLTGVTGGGLPAEIWHEVMVRINEGVEPKPLIKEIPESTYAPIDPGTSEGAVAAEDVPYFDDPNARGPGRQLTTAGRDRATENLFTRRERILVRAVVTNGGTPGHCAFEESVTMLAGLLDLSVIRDLPASVMVLDRDLRFAMASDLYLGTVGRSMDELRGVHVFDAFPEVDERRRPLEASMRLALAGEGNAIKRLLYTIPNTADPSSPTLAWWRCRHNPLVGPDGQIGHIAQITENITELVRAEDQRNAIQRELQHRVGNLLSLVQIVARRTAGSAETLADFMVRFDDRMLSLGRTHSYLIGTNWNRMSIGEVVARQLQHGHEELAAQISVAGPEVFLGASEAQMLSMAIHELTTNSLKYGALKDASGHLAVSWSEEVDQGFSFAWIESGVSALAPSERKGFGTMILDTILPAQLNGKAQRGFAPDGLHYRLTAKTQAPPA